MAGPARTGEQVVLALQGDWIAQSGAHSRLSAGGLAAGRRGRNPGTGHQAVGRWDSGLIEFLWDAKRAAATERHRPSTAPPLPASARTLLGLLPDRLVAETPIRQPAPRVQPLHWIGGRTIGLLTEVGMC